MDAATDMTVSRVPRTRLPKGFELGGYVVEGWLRDGGMASIHRARRLRDGRRMALKLQLPSTVHDPAIGRRFDLEAELMWRAGGGAHGVELHDAGALDDGRRWLMMEWIDGENLEELLDFQRNQDQRLPIERACRIGHDLLRRLVELHGQGVVHLDLKPANVMVSHLDDGSDMVKLIDLGIAVDLWSVVVRGGGTDSSPGGWMGTSAYMSPEQVEGAPCEPSFDLYAWGVLMFEALSGKCLPPHGWSSETLPRLETLRRGVPSQLAALVRRCMERDPRRRPESAEAAARALVGIMRQLEHNDGQQLARRAHAPLATAGGADGAVAREHGRGPGWARARFVPVGMAAAPSNADELLGQAAKEAGLEPRLKKVRRVRDQRWLVVAAVAAVIMLGGAFARLVGYSSSLLELGTVRASTFRRERPTKASRPRPDAPRPIADETPERAAAQAEPRSSVGLENAERPVDPTTVGSSSRIETRMTRPSKQECAKSRRAALDAKSVRAWARVLRATAPRQCWGTSALRLERARLRVEAFAEQGIFGKCVNAGRNSQDREIAARVGFCRKQLGG